MLIVELHSTIISHPCKSENFPNKMLKSEIKAFSYKQKLKCFFGQQTWCFRNFLILQVEGKQHHIETQVHEKSLHKSTQRKRNENGKYGQNTYRNYGARVLQLLKPAQSPCSATREATAMRSPRATTKGSPRSLRLEKVHMQQQRPNAAKN